MNRVSSFQALILAFLVSAAAFGQNPTANIAVDVLLARSSRSNIIPTR